MKNDVDFLEVVINKDAMLDRVLLLNFTEQDKVARSILKHSVNFSN